MFKKYLTTAFFSLTLFLSVFNTNAQNIAIGEWRTQLPYNQVVDVAVAGDIIFAATSYSMFTYNTGDSRIELIDKVKGLSDVGINKIDYNKSLGALLGGLFQRQHGYYQARWFNHQYFGHKRQRYSGK